MRHESRSHDGPRFSLRVKEQPSGRVDMYVDDDDFGYDATIEWTGDFDLEARKRYGQAICDALNAAPMPTPNSGDEKHG